MNDYERINMTDVLVIDIETVRDETTSEDLLQSMYDKIEVKADGRIKDPDAIAANYKEKYDAAVGEITAKFGLSPMTGKICCVGWWKGSYAAGSDRIDWATLLPESVEDENELICLKKAAELINSLSQLSTLVGFNSKSFDLPFIKVRCAVKGIGLQYRLRDSKYDLSMHFDVRSALTNFEQFGKGTLTQWSMLFGCSNEYSLDGSMVQSLYDVKDLITIGRKCRDDVSNTGRIYEKIFRYF